METKQKRTKVVVSVLVLAGLVVFALTAVGGNLEPSAPPGPTMKTLDEVEPRIPIHASDLPLTITEPNSYYLVETVNFANTTSHAITIECNDVTIDLMGYTLKGPDSGTGHGIFMYGRTNVEIRNGTVRDFYDGICEDSSSGRDHRVIDVRSVSNGRYGIWLEGKSHLVKDCTASDNGHLATGSGILAGTGSTVTGNTVNNNGSFGILAGTGSTVIGNTAHNNGSHGINAGDGCTVTRNTVHFNQKSGIDADTGCTVTGNTARLNNQSDMAVYAGISVYAGCLVKGNTAARNRQNNICVYNFENAIEENLVADCDAGNGIYFYWSGNFYANNRARGNATDYAGSLPTGSGDGGGNVSF